MDPTLQKVVVMWSERQLTLPWTLAGLWFSVVLPKGRLLLLGYVDHLVVSHGSLLQCPGYLTSVRSSVMDAHIPQSLPSPVREGLPLSL